jgi:hypothetical protein
MKSRHCRSPCGEKSGWGGRGPGWPERQVQVAGAPGSAHCGTCTYLLPQVDGYIHCPKICVKQDLWEGQRLRV